MSIQQRSKNSILGKYLQDDVLWWRWWRRRCYLLELGTDCLHILWRNRISIPIICAHPLCYSGGTNNISHISNFESCVKVHLTRVKTQKTRCHFLGSRIKRIFHDQADRKKGGGGGGSAPSVLTVSIFENFAPFLAFKFDSLILITHFISSWGVSKMHFSYPQRLCSTAIHPFCDRACVKSVSEHL